MKNQKEAELKKVIKLIRRDHPHTVDYNVVSDDFVELLDKNDLVVGHLTERALTRYWNDMEGT